MVGLPRPALRRRAAHRARARSGRSSPSSSTSTSARASSGSHRIRDVAACSSPRAGTRATVARDRRGGPRAGRRPDHLRRGVDLIEQHRARGRHRRHRLGLARGDRRRRSAATSAPTRRSRAAPQLDEDGPLHGGDGLLRLRPVQGRRDPRARRASEDSTSPAPSPTPTRYTDLPMLEAVGQPGRRQPRPGPAATSHASRGWEIRNFVRPVRLRDRVRDRVRGRPSPAIALSAGAIAVGVPRSPSGGGSAAGARRASALAD